MRVGVDNVTSCQPAPPHSYSPHYEGMRDQSRSSHLYSGRNSGSNVLMTPMSATNNETTSISSNHSNGYYSNNSNNSNNYNTTSTNNNNNTALTISSPTSHPTATNCDGIVVSLSYDIYTINNDTIISLSFPPSSTMGTTRLFIFFILRRK